MPAAPSLPPLKLPPFRAPMLETEVPFLEPHYLPLPEVPAAPQARASSLPPCSTLVRPCKRAMPAYTAGRSACSTPIHMVQRSRSDAPACSYGPQASMQTRPANLTSAPSLSLSLSLALCTPPPPTHTHTCSHWAPQEDALPVFRPPELLMMAPLQAPEYVAPEPPVLAEAPRPPAFGAPKHGHDWTGERPFQVGRGGGGQCGVAGGGGAALGLLWEGRRGRLQGIRVHLTRGGGGEGSSSDKGGRVLPMVPTWQAFIHAGDPTTASMNAKG